MIENLDERAKWWGEHANTADSYRPIPEEYLGRLRDQDVLEVGPGYGRMVRDITGVARSYRVADISPVVLGLPIFGPYGRELIVSYNQPNDGDRHGTAVCWFVLHHVREEELGQFINFLMKRSTYVLLNVPDSYGGYDGGTVADDGMRTTERPVQDVIDAFENRGMKLQSQSLQEFDSHVLYFEPVL